MENVADIMIWYPIVEWDPKTIPNSLFQSECFENLIFKFCASFQELLSDKTVKSIPITWYCDN